MTYNEWVETVPRGKTINPAMAFAAGVESCAPEIAKLKDAFGYDWDKYKACQEALREHMLLVRDKDAEIAELLGMREEVLHYQREFHRKNDEIAELVTALEHCKDWFNAAGIEVPASLQANAALAKVRKS